MVNWMGKLWACTPIRTHKPPAWQWPSLVSRFNVNPCMDKWQHPSSSVWRINLSIPKLQRLHRWCLVILNNFISHFTGQTITYSSCLRLHSLQGPFPRGDIRKDLPSKIMAILCLTFSQAVTTFHCVVWFIFGIKNTRKTFHISSIVIT